MKLVAEQGNTVLFVSHNVASVQNLCTRAVFLDQGKLLYDGSVEKAIVLYFGETSRKEKDYNLFEIKWNTEERPGNDYIKVNKIKITDTKGEDLKAITISKPFLIHINFDIVKSTARPIFSISLHATSGDPVFGSISNVEKKLYEQHYALGTYQMQCEIPGNLINSGHFYINVNGYTEEFTNHFGIENPLGFEAFDDGVLRKEYSGGFGGYIRPLLNWDVIKK